MEGQPEKSVESVERDRETGRDRRTHAGAAGRHPVAEGPAGRPPAARPTTSGTRDDVRDANETNLEDSFWRFG